MPKRPVQFPRVFGVRLSEDDGKKLLILAYQCRRSPSETLRLLVRCAQAVDIPPVQFVPPGAEAQREA
jgi:hypothetical protein